MDIPTPEEEFGESPALSCRTLRVCLQSQETQSPPVNLRFKVLRDAAAVDEDCQQLVEFVRSGFSPSMRNVPTSLRGYWNGREHLSLDSGIVMKGDRIVVPESLRETVLADLHAAHQGLTRTKNSPAPSRAHARSCSGPASPPPSRHSSALARVAGLIRHCLPKSRCGMIVSHHSRSSLRARTCSRSKVVNSWFMSIALLDGHVSQQLDDPPRRMM